MCGPAVFNKPPHQIVQQGRREGSRHLLFTSLSEGRPSGLAVSAMVAFFVLVHGIWFITVPGDLDAFNFVLGIRDFDVTHHRPHPPGAPVFVAAGKVASWFWQALGLPADSLAGPEPAALAALSLIAGTLTIVLAWRILRLLDGPSAHASRATLVVASAPLLWIAAARHLSDAIGAVLVLATYLWTIRNQTYVASALAGVAMGLRVQTALLTMPALVIAVMRDRRGKTAAAMIAWFAVGVIAWLLPLLVAAGGPEEYWTALSIQANDDLSSSIVLAATPTLRNAADALFNTLVQPWGVAALAVVMLSAALAGAVRLQRTSARHAALLLICAAPYVVFHIVFHETATVRYALPIVLGLAYLAAVAVDGLPSGWRRTATALLVVANLFVSVRVLHAYSRDSAPAMALLKAMDRRAAVESPAFVTSHSHLSLPRLQEVLAPAPPWQTVSWPEHYEWQSMVGHWRRGATAPVWFVADPRRTNLSLIDRRSRRMLGSFGLDARAEWVLNGLRPKAVTWWEFRAPAWIAVKGFALTPEVGGLAARDGHGPALGGAVALVRRSPTGAVLVAGGRHLGDASDPPVRIAIEIDGRPVHSVVASAQERDYAALVHLSASQLQGDGPYATVTIRSAALTATANPIPVTVEQFDYQSAEGVLFAFASGWHEPELESSTGETWRWASRRARLLVHRPSRANVELKVSGGMPPLRGDGLPQRIEVASADRVLDTFATRSAFSRSIVVPRSKVDACDIEITFESTMALVPVKAGQGADTRELAFRAFDIDVVPLPR